MKMTFNKRLNQLADKVRPFVQLSKEQHESPYLILSIFIMEIFTIIFSIYLIIKLTIEYFTKYG